jgi:hypothetical protein
MSDEEGDDSLLFGSEGIFIGLMAPPDHFNPQTYEDGGKQAPKDALRQEVGEHPPRKSPQDNPDNEAGQYRKYDIAMPPVRVSADCPCRHEG